ncbi:MAG TPA: hypothetical protein VFP68_05480 [Burkholderiaceae bacterium]|nr:hypothetical protein [Burkholderiaceae bacterium]
MSHATRSAAGSVRRHVLAALAALSWMAGAFGADETNSSSPPSEAEQLLFVQPHLSNIEPPRTLHYRYVRTTPRGRTEDDVTLSFTESGPHQCCSVHGQYLSGAQALNLPDMAEARSNPVLLYFLEHQVRQLQQRTGGNAAHFRRIARMSIAESATITPGSIQWQGKEVAARTVRVKPYVNDPYRQRFAAEAGTEYSFVLADAVPGAVYQLRAAVTDPRAAREEVLTLDDEQPK